MSYFPLFVDLKDKKCCVIGGGIVALRKIEALLEFEADITVIAPELCDEIRQLQGKLHLIQRTYRMKDLEGGFLVIAATDAPEVNSEVSKACRNRNIPVNVVDELDQCTFLFPAYLRRGKISIGVTTAGKSPVIAGHIKNIIQNHLPDYYAELVDTLGEYRDYVKQRVSAVEKRSAIFKELAKTGLEQEGSLTKEDVETIIARLE